MGQQDMFRYTMEHEADLSSTHIELLEILRQQPQVVNTYLVSVTGFSDAGTREYFSLNLPEEKTLTIQRTSISTTKLNQIRWNGNTGEAASEVRLLVSEEGITGMIRSKNHNYDIHPFRDTGFHLLVEIDPSKFEHELPPLTLEVEPENQKKAIHGIDPVHTMSNPEIRVMVVYTTNAKNNHSGSITNMITLAEGNMSDAFTTSGVNADITVVHTAEISYSESSDDVLNLCRLTMSETHDPRLSSVTDDCDSYSDGSIVGYLDQIHEWRYQHDAHLVVLITGSGGTGLGWMPALNNYAFSIARYDVAASFNTMAHEIGHNLGAAHDTSNAGTPVYAYGHGYNYAPSQWSTIMAYPPSGFSRINRFSTPLKTFGGVATGTAQYEDNARAMNNRVNSVANFSPPAPLPSPPSLSINTSGFSPELNWGSVSGATSYKVYTGTVTGAPGTVNCNSVSSFSLLDTTTSTSYTDYSVIIDPYESIFVCYYVTSVNSTGESNPSNKVGTHAMAPLKEIADRQIPDDYSLFQNYPNPFNPSTTFAFGLPEEAHVSLKVFNMTGQLVATLMSNPMSAGLHDINWQADRLPSGIYILQMQAVGVSGETHRFMQKLTLLK